MRAALFSALKLFLTCFILVLSLKRQLATQAQKICDEKDRIRGDKINITPLQISTKAIDMEQLDQFRHFHHRENVVRVYSEKPPDVIPHEQIFEVAERFLVRGTEECNIEEAKAVHILRYGTLLLISGQARIGKSTPSKLLVKKYWIQIFIFTRQNSCFLSDFVTSISSEILISNF